MKEKEYNDWWNSLNTKQKSICYWKMGDYFASEE
jgi:hypothetical protein